MRRKAIQNSRSRACKRGPTVRPLHRHQLLPERQVLQDQFSMSAESQRQRPTDDDQQLEHVSIVAGAGARINSDEFWRGSTVAGVTICTACRQFGQRSRAVSRAADRSTERGRFEVVRCSTGKLMPKRENFGRELEAESGSRPETRPPGR